MFTSIAQGLNCMNLRLVTSSDETLKMFWVRSNQISQPIRQQHIPKSLPL
ncbi:hypothetical protein [Microcoleus anatoxicus]|uniref:Uncharacterized protein n=1 Tax=Microcoleus anatoxicus PTRS2 TaxID=2705321 RepID=A0ABU8YK29_9CYAN